MSEAPRLREAAQRLEMLLLNVAEELQRGETADAESSLRAAINALPALAGAALREPPAPELPGGDIQDDIGLLLRELGLGDHARPVSPHWVMVNEIAPAIRALRAGSPQTGTAPPKCTNCGERITATHHCVVTFKSPENL